VQDKEARHFINKNYHMHGFTTFLYSPTFDLNDNFSNKLARWTVLKALCDA
jgi:uncharacterized metal-binding protein